MFTPNFVCLYGVYLHLADRQKNSLSNRMVLFTARIGSCQINWTHIVFYQSNHQFIIVDIAGILTKKLSQPS